MANRREFGAGYKFWIQVRGPHLGRDQFDVCAYPFGKFACNVLEVAWSLGTQVVS